MLNARHKALLFLTLVAAGSALLTGADFRQASGIVLLGLAAAWLVGSWAATKAYKVALGLPGQSWPWVRLLLALMIGGALFGTIGITSGYNQFITTTTMAAYGIVISPLAARGESRARPAGRRT